MKRKAHILIVLFLLAGMFITVVDCANSGPKTPQHIAQAQKRPIKIGVLNPLTGIFAVSGVAANNATRMFFDELGYEIAGRKVKLFFEDTEMKPEVGLTKAKRLVEMERVDMLMGVVSSGVAYALRDYVTSQKVPLLISTAGGADELTKRAAVPYILRSSMNNFRCVAVLADYAYKHLGYRRMNVVALDFVAGYEYAAGFAMVFRKLGGEIIQEMYTPINTADFSPYLTKLNKTADALYTFVPGGAGLRFVKQYKGYGLKDKIPHICNYTTEEEVLQQQGDDALGVINANNWSPALELPSSKKLVETYYKKYNESPTALSLLGYIGSMIVADAIKAVKGNVEDTQAFLKALKAVTLDDTPQGKVKFDDWGCIIYDMHITRAEKVEGKPWKYENKVIYTYKMVDQFWPYTPKEYMAGPVLSKLKGKIVGKGPLR